MTDTDVLVKWGDIISVAESGSKAIDYYAPSPLADCIADLAAEVRALRQLHIDDDARYMKAIERIVGADDEIMVLKARVAELESTAYPRDALCDTYESRLDELNQENRGTA